MKTLLLILGFFLLSVQALFASDAETEKIQWHLDRVETILRKVDTSPLSLEQKENRLKILDRLHIYTEAGKFPNNDLFPGQSVPFFRGSNGNLCAVGYLMDADPEYKGFIEKVVSTNNNISLMDAADNVIIQSWLQKYGFTLLEASMIQPTYDFEFKCSYWNIKQCSFSETINIIRERWNDSNTTSQDKDDFIWRLLNIVGPFLIVGGALSILFILSCIHFYFWVAGNNKISKIKGKYYIHILNIAIVMGLGVYIYDYGYPILIITIISISIYIEYISRMKTFGEKLAFHTKIVGITFVLSVLLFLYYLTLFGIVCKFTLEDTDINCGVYGYVDDWLSIGLVSLIILSIYSIFKYIIPKFLK